MTSSFGTIAPSGDLTYKIIRAAKPGLLYRLRNLPNMWRGLWRKKVAELAGIPTMYAELEAVVIHADGRRTNYGVIATRMVTDAFVADIVDTLQAVGTTFDDYKFHASGTGTNAEAAANTALQTDSGVARATGTQVEASANAYRSVGTQTYAGTLAITEHGLFNASSAGILMDRSVFAALNVVATDQIQWTYTITFSSGG